MRLQSFLDLLSRLQQRHALLLFLALGALLFTVDGLRRHEPILQLPESVGEGQSATQWLEDEVLYREALARGLGDGDLIVRRRLVQKMRLLLETGVDVAEPSDAELRRWIDTHAGRYGGVERISLDHVFLSRGRHDARLGSEATTLGTRLRGGEAFDLDALSDPHPGGTRLDAIGSRELERLFGSMLARELAELPAGDWQGPLPSALGLHFVRIRDRRLQAPDYAAVHEAAQRDYLLERRREASRIALAELKARYGLTTEMR